MPPNRVEQLLGRVYGPDVAHALRQSIVDAAAGGKVKGAKSKAALDVQSVLRLLRTPAQNRPKEAPKKKEGAGWNGWGWGWIATDCRPPKGCQEALVWERNESRQEEGRAGHRGGRVGGAGGFGWGRIRAKWASGHCCVTVTAPTRAQLRLEASARHTAGAINEGGRNLIWHKASCYPPVPPAALQQHA